MPAFIFYQMAIPNEVSSELDLQNAGELKCKNQDVKDRFGVLGNGEILSVSVPQICINPIIPSKIPRP
jgi:hypothetical protein